MFVRHHHFGSKQSAVSSPRRRSGHHSRRGQSLVEFALVALVVYMLLAAILTFGHMLYVAQGAQQAVDVAAREISRMPLPADSHTLEQILHGDANSDAMLIGVRQQIYDEHYLVLNLDTLHGRENLQELIADLPVVNQQLVPLMISDEIDGTRVLRYPGAIFTDGNTADDPVNPPPSGFLVAIPLVVDRDEDGQEQIELVSVVEEIDSEANPDPFRISSERHGIVALRINYPFQSASMSGFRPRPPIGEPGGTDIGSPYAASEAEDVLHGTYAGQYGLGVHQAFGQRVRPFRRVISAQAIYRREVFAE